MSQSSKPVPLAVPNELLKLIDAAAAATKRTRSELMRLAIEIGIEDLRRIDHNIAGALVNAAALTKANDALTRPATPAATIPLPGYLREDPPEAGGKKRHIS